MIIDNFFLVKVIQVVIGILILSAAWYNQVKQRPARLVFEWVTLVVHVSGTSRSDETEVIGAAL